MLFPALYYRADPPNQFQIYMALPPQLSAWSHVPTFAAWLFMHALIPFVYFLFLVRYWRVGRALAPEQRGRLMLLNFTGIFLFLGIATAPGWTRLSSISMPGLILLVWLVNQSSKLGLIMTRSFAGVALMFAVFAPLKLQRTHMYHQDLPAGRLAWSHEADYEVARWLQERTEPWDFFFGGANRDFFFPLYLQDPAKVPFVGANAYTRPDHVQDLVESLERFHVRYVLWQPMLAREHGKGDNLQPLREFLSKNYHVAHTFISSDEILERDESHATCRAEQR